MRDGRLSKHRTVAVSQGVVAVRAKWLPFFANSSDSLPRPRPPKVRSRIVACRAMGGKEITIGDWHDVPKRREELWSSYLPASRRPCEDGPWAMVRPAV